MKTFLLILVIIWFTLGASVAHDRGYFDFDRSRDCAFVGSAALTVVAGPLGYAGVHPRAFC
jgi:hypothetical protein